jgi:hypothetical protein
VRTAFEPALLREGLLHEWPRLTNPENSAVTKQGPCAI